MDGVNVKINQINQWIDGHCGEKKNWRKENGMPMEEGEEGDQPGRKMQSKTRMPLTDCREYGMMMEWGEMGLGDWLNDEVQREGMDSAR